MASRPRIIYPSLQQPVQLTIVDPQDIYSKWGFGWSEPVRNAAIAVALIASGCVFPLPTEAETVTESRWHYPWSEPVRVKPGLNSALQQYFTGDPIPFPTVSGMGWFAPLADPVRIKIGLRADLQQFFTADSELPPTPAEYLIGYNWWSEPVRLPIGLKAWLQQTTAMPPRLLPTPTVFATMDAVETNTDVALFGINVYNSVTPPTSGQGAKVSITEVPVPGNDPTSIRES